MAHDRRAADARLHGRASRLRRRHRRLPCHQHRGPDAGSGACAHRRGGGRARAGLPLLEPAPPHPLRRPPRARAGREPLPHRRCRRPHHRRQRARHRRDHPSKARVARRALRLPPLRRDRRRGAPGRRARVPASAIAPQDAGRARRGRDGALSWAYPPHGGDRGRGDRPVRRRGLVPGRATRVETHRFRSAHVPTHHGGRPFAALAARGHGRRVRPAGAEPERTSRPYRAARSRVEGGVRQHRSRPPHGRSRG